MEKAGTFRRVGTVTAVQLARPTRWTTATGDTLTGHQGDWLVTDESGDQRTVSQASFNDLYAALPDGRFRRKGTVQARRVLASETVETQEGTATARPGDWIVTADDGTSWPVPDSLFRYGYEEYPEGS